MKIYTSYYANLKNIPKDYITIAISGGVSEGISENIDIWDKRLAPSKDIFNEYKSSLDGPIRERIFAKRFITEVLDNLDINTIIKDWASKFVKDKNYVMICYETPKDFCHRQIVAEYMEKKYNISIKEYGIDDSYERVDYKYKLTSSFDKEIW